MIERTCLYSFFIILGTMQISSCESESITSEQNPNVIIVITDDQGYGDLACHGNSWLSTPNLDELHSQSVRLTDFHVSPTCSPTRAALMTGLYTNRTGSWHTVNGRSMVFDEFTLLPEILSNNGYNTGIFGKWHLGDNHPFRPQDNGFSEVLTHGGGGVGQAPDYFGNDYFNDTYWRNGTPEKFEGYCTDIFFNEAIKYIETKANREQPFFCYISTNAPHTPLYIADSYSKKYKNKDGVVNPHFNGMLENIDDNVGKLTATLEKLQIQDNTILIFMTDNGGWGGIKQDKERFVTAGFNSGMRGGKNSEYEGGHRVPFFIRWPDGGFEGGRDIGELTAHIDLLPTFVELLNLNLEIDYSLDGISLASLLKEEVSTLPTRVVITDSQRLDTLQKWRRSATMQGPWRLINGKELYHIGKDPEQRENIANQHPGKVDELIAAYDEWWTDISPSSRKIQYITLCHETEPKTVLHAMDLHCDENYFPIWRQEHERVFQKSLGWYAVNAPVSGRYKFSFHRYQPESELRINDVAPVSTRDKGTNVVPFIEGKMADVVLGHLIVDNKEYSTGISEDGSITMEVDLSTGKHILRTEFESSDGERNTVYHTSVERLN